MDDFDEIINIFDHSGLKYKAYPKTYLINAEDTFGVIQSYYASTHTAIFRDSNDKFNQQRKTVRDLPVDEFIELCKDGDKILDE